MALFSFGRQQAARVSSSQGRSLQARRASARRVIARGRRLRVEPLEERSLLAVGPWAFTSDTDFDLGTFLNVQHDSPAHDQLQLTAETEILPFIWVPNNDGTISRLNTETGNELGRYRVAPHATSEPSRTTVDLDGSCWVGVRDAGTAVKVGHWEVGQWIDRNDDGIIQTSSDVNGDGKITGDEILAWGEDEAVLFEVVLIPDKEGTYLPGVFQGGYDYGHWATSPRGLAVDSNNNLWVGTYSSSKY